MKVRILGVGGMLGGMAERYFKSLDKYDVQAVSNKDYRADYRDPNDARVLGTQGLSNGDHVINCIGAIKPKFNSIDQTLASIYVNAIFPRKLADECETAGVKLTHITTDCLVKNTRILTDCGFRNIQDISIGDAVFTHTGKLQAVYDIKRKEYNGEIINLSFVGGTKISCTPNHPILAIIRNAKEKPDFNSATWIRAEKLNKHNLVFVPLPENRFGTEISFINLLNYSEKEKEAYDFYQYVISKKDSISNVSEIVPSRNRSKYNKALNYIRKDIKPKNLTGGPLELTIDEDVAWLLGLYLAEGSVCNRHGDNQITFSIGDELNQFSEIVRILNKVGFKVWTRKHNNQKGFQINTSFKLMAEFLKKEFYISAPYECFNKKIPDFVFGWKENLVDSFIKGFSSGDAHINTESGLFTTNLSSRQAIDDLRLLLLMRGVYARYRTSTQTDSNINNRAIKGTQFWQLNITGLSFRKFAQITNLKIKDNIAYYSRIFHTQDGWYVPISDISLEKFNGEVFNLEVRNDHSYLVDGFLSFHNCVFSGSNGKYTEFSNHDALDQYGKSKSLGEPENALVIRTSIIGPEWHGNRRSLVEWFVGKNGGKADGYMNHMWNGLTTLELCKSINKIIDNDMHQWDMFHLYSTDISKYELLQKMAVAFDLNIQINPVNANEACDRTLRTCKQWQDNLKPMDIDGMLREVAPYTSTVL